MAKLYIANGKQQYEDFIYILPERRAPYRQQIAPGSQIMLSGDLSGPDIDAVIEQHTKYGLVNISEVDRTKPFIGLCYSIDKPIKLEGIQNVLQHNRLVLTEQGRRQREAAAIATTQSIEQNIFERQMPDQLTNFEMTIQEDTATRDPNAEATPPVADAIRVVSDIADADATPRIKIKPRRGRGDTA